MIEANHRGFLLEGKPFSQHIEKGNIIRLPAHLEDDLNWETQKQEAKTKDLLFWDLDLGLKENHFEENSAFFSYSLAIQAFSSQLWEDFQDRSWGLSLYKGKLLCSDIESIQVFADFLLQLVAFLPDELNVFCLFDVSDRSNQVEIARLISKVRFEHIHIALKGAGFPLSNFLWDEGLTASCRQETIGICLPLDAHWSEQVEKELSALMTLHPNARIISEQYLTEQWDEIETLIVLPHAISSLGKRKLLGFIAAGGKIEEFKLESQLAL